jgi:hypothetical protein
MWSRRHSQRHGASAALVALLGIYLCLWIDIHPLFFVIVFCLAACLQLKEVQRRRRCVTHYPLTRESSQ